MKLCERCACTEITYTQSGSNRRGDLCLSRMPSLLTDLFTIRFRLMTYRIGRYLQALRLFSIGIRACTSVRKSLAFDLVRAIRQRKYRNHQRGQIACIPESLLPSIFRLWRQYELSSESRPRTSEQDLTSTSVPVTIVLKDIRFCNGHMTNLRFVS